MVCEGIVEATDDPKKMPREAGALMRQGRYADSLQKHLWFHDHALEHQQALAGVRLSFALAYWLELAACYPEAMQALTAVRVEPPWDRPVCPVVWEGWSREAPPHPDQ
jgi:hypothetical protein